MSALCLHLAANHLDSVWFWVERAQLCTNQERAFSVETSKAKVDFIHCFKNRGLTSLLPEGDFRLCIEPQLSSPTCCGGCGSCNSQHMQMHQVFTLCRRSEVEKKKRLWFEFQTHFLFLYPTALEQQACGVALARTCDRSFALNENRPQLLCDSFNCCIIQQLLNCFPA